MCTLMASLKAEEDKLNQELEGSHGNYDIMKVVFENRIDLYKQFLKEESPTELDKPRLENKKEWTMSHLLNLIIEQELRDRLTDLTQRVYRLEKAAQLD
jgi:hypothetical protein